MTLVVAGASPVVHPKVMDRIKLGAAAEHIFVAKCLLAGFECYLPVTASGKIDVIVGRSVRRCQVKAICQQSKRSRGISTRKVGCNSKSNVKVSRYTVEDIDFMVGVDVKTFDVYVIPAVDAVVFSRAISVGTMAGRGWKNALSLFEK